MAPVPDSPLARLIGDIQAGALDLAVRLDWDQGAGPLRLRALSPRLAAGAELVAALTAWRNRYRSSYLTQFTATAEGTARYLRDRVLGDPGALMVLVEVDGRLAGHYGFRALTARTAELDALARTPDPLPPGAMRAAAGALCRWLLETMALETLHGGVLRNNAAALMFNRSLGAQLGARTPVWTHQVDADRCELRPEPATAGELPTTELVAITVDAVGMRTAYPELFRWPLVVETGRVP